MPQSAAHLWAECQLKFFSLFFTAAFEISKLNWTSIILALAIVGLEVGYVFVYRAGWTVSTASVVANIGLACVLIVVGYFLYRENISFNQILGIIACMIGLILINF